jgi:hypothetical protein
MLRVADAQLVDVHVRRAYVVSNEARVHLPGDGGLADAGRPAQPQQRQIARHKRSQCRVAGQPATAFRQMTLER